MKKEKKVECYSDPSLHYAHTEKENIQNCWYSPRNTVRTVESQSYLFRGGWVWVHLVKTTFPTRAGTMLSISHSSVNSLQVLCPVQNTSFSPLSKIEWSWQEVLLIIPWTINHSAVELCYLYVGRECVSRETLSRQMAPSAVITAEADRQSGPFWAWGWLLGWPELSRTATVRVLGRVGEPAPASVLFVLGSSEGIKLRQEGFQFLLIHSFTLTDSSDPRWPWAGTGPCGWPASPASLCLMGLSQLLLPWLHQMLTTVNIAWRIRCCGTLSTL